MSSLFIRSELIAIGDDIEAVLGSNLDDYQQASNLTWVSHSENHIRKMFKFQIIGGSVYSAVWGFSIDFVPYPSGRKLVWKRSAQKARFDLCIDPIDEEGRPPQWCSFSYPREPGRCESSARAAFEAGREYFRDFRTPADLCILFGKRSRMKFRRFSLSNYGQTDLAWGLALLATGDEREGQIHIDEYCRRFEIDPKMSILQKAMMEARASAHGAAAAR